MVKVNTRGICLRQAIYSRLFNNTEYTNNELYMYLKGHNLLFGHSKAAVLLTIRNMYKSGHFYMRRRMKLGENTVRKAYHYSIPEIETFI